MDEYVMMIFKSNSRKCTQNFKAKSAKNDNFKTSPNGVKIKIKNKSNGMCV